MHHHDEHKDLRKKMGCIRPSKGLTFYLFCLDLIIIVSACIGYFHNALNLTGLSLILIAAYYFIAMCVHDAIHLCAHRNSLLNLAVGWIGSVLLAMPYPAIRRSHLQHHGARGHRKDTESFLYRAGITLPLRLIVANFYCYTALLTAKRTEKLQGWLTLLSLASTVLCQPEMMFICWFCPMQIGVALFAFNTVFLPHGPLARLLHASFPVLTGFHHHHHAIPQLPWYQLFQVARKLKLQGNTSCRHHH